MLALLFQLTAARRRLARKKSSSPTCLTFQLTAARRRLGRGGALMPAITFVSTHSRPKAAGALSASNPALMRVSTHSRPKAAGTACCPPTTAPPFQLTAARRRLGGNFYTYLIFNTFQLTAARRRLANQWRRRADTQQVSTHSRPKAAGGARRTNQAKD